MTETTYLNVALIAKELGLRLGQTPLDGPTNRGEEFDMLSALAPEAQAIKILENSNWSTLYSVGVIYPLIDPDNPTGAYKATLVTRGTLRK